MSGVSGLVSVTNELRLLVGGVQGLVALWEEIRAAAELVSPNAPLKPDGLPLAGEAV